MDVWIGFFDFSLAVACLISIVGSLIILYLVLFEFDSLMGRFRNSKAISVRKGFVDSFWGRWFIVGTMCAMVTFSNKQIRQGALDREDYENLPRWLVWLFRGVMSLALFWLVSMVILIEVGESMGWMSK